MLDEGGDGACQAQGRHWCSGMCTSVWVSVLQMRHRYRGGLFSELWFVVLGSSPFPIFSSEVGQIVALSKELACLSVYLDHPFRKEVKDARRQHLLNSELTQNFKTSRRF